MNVERSENLVDFPSFTTPAEYYDLSDSRASAILLPAMGTKAAFYKPFAERLSEEGFSVLLPDIPGTGESRPRPSRKTDYGYRDLVSRWLPGLLDFARARRAGRPLVLMGHSLGAQLGVIASGTGRVKPDALVTIAGGHIHYRNWEGAEAVKVRFGAALFPFLTHLFGYLPGQHVGFGGPQARTLIRDWAGLIRTGRFGQVAGQLEMNGSPPMLALGFAGDFYAPMRSVSALAALLGGESESVVPDWPGSPHSSWARHPGPTVSRVTEWLGRHGI